MMDLLPFSNVPDWKFSFVREESELFDGFAFWHRFKKELRNGPHYAFPNAAEVVLYKSLITNKYSKAVELSFNFVGALNFTLVT